MKSITHNSRLSLILLYGYQEKNFKIDIPKITNKFIIGEDSRNEQISLLQVS